jgi:hypothetical protein
MAEITSGSGVEGYRGGGRIGSMGWTASLRGTYLPLDTPDPTPAWAQGVELSSWIDGKSRLGQRSMSRSEGYG